MSRSSRRAAVNIDNDDSIDFSAVSAAAAAARPAAPFGLFSPNAETDEKKKIISAEDGRLRAFAQRPAPRRRATFGGTHLSNNAHISNGATVSKSANVSESANVSKSANVSEGAGEAAARLESFWREDAARREEASNATRRSAYESQLKSFLSLDERRCECSLIEQFFADGVPDVEPWDMWALSMPRYSSSSSASSSSSFVPVLREVEKLLNCVHHPLLPETHFSRHFLRRAAERPPVVRQIKTKEEMRAERRERLRKEKEERDRARRAAEREKQKEEQQPQSTESTHVTLRVAAKDRLTNANIRFNLFSDSVLNPLSTENKVFTQYQERFLEHQRRNHDRHVEAIPRQIKKREADLKRHAEENPHLRAYRIFPIYSAEHLGKLRRFANDGRLRGFVLWIARCDALLVLAGGEAALRHVERWILEKMRWESSETTASRLLTVPLQSHEAFSFHAKGKRKRKRQAPENGEGKGEDEEEKEEGEEEERQHVFMNFAETVEEGEQFMRSMPTDGPWRDLSHIWRAAFAVHTIPES